MDDRGALIVGIDDYPTSPLPGCIKDATQVASLLKSHEDGSLNFTIELVTSDKFQIKRTTLRRKIEQLFSKKAEIALFYFSGHGTENNLGGYIVSQDATQYDEGVSLAEILMLANASPATERIIILDSCNSGYLGNPPFVYNAALLQEGVTILTASRSNEVALQSGEGSIFTSLLLNALEGEAADILGHISLSSIYNFIDRNLGFFDQRPLYKSYVSKFTSLRNTIPTLSNAMLRRLTEFFADKNAVFPLDKSFEVTEKEHFMEENGEKFSVLQKYRAAGLVEPLPPEEHLYWAAVRQSGCRLTKLGKNYWYLAKKGRI